MSAEWQDRARQVLSYHRRTKHHLHRYAQGPGHLDWATQPDPFRTYAGVPAVDLPLLADALSASYGDLCVPGRVAPRRLDVNSLAILFELSLGLSAWKEYRGSRWALRCNPSSGNLHPTEGYLIVPACPGVDAGVYHYVSHDHRLERRCTLDAGGCARLFGPLTAGTFFVGLSSVHWREAWKYGERAYRYCQHDAGHAVAAVRYAAGCLGWSALLLDALGDDEVSALLGLDRDESFAGLDLLDREHPDCLLLVGPPPLAQTHPDAGAVAGLTWTGKANPLSPRHVRWEIIDIVAEAARKPLTGPSPSVPPVSLPPLPALSPISAATLIRQRRSCLGLDGRTQIDAMTLYAILDRLLPRPGVAPWDALPWRPHLHAGLFVHRVRGLASGLYLFERNAGVHDALRAACRPEFTWTRPADCPEHLRLFLLEKGDFRELSQRVSCHQEIASDGAFSLGMIAELGDTIRDRGPWWYRRLFWESGVLGQVLYLEAEAAGVRGTGIGCYFDDAFHELLGLTGDRFQDLYHFTMGGPVDDPRLRTLAPYAHLGRR
ncbi:MAG: SagB/ThcOx family dehydrogenase [Planctomycetes bacterium]|nr:SagB/ThcOx family dehydrogenase [Planctomycetota bacterium]